MDELTVDQEPAGGGTADGDGDEGAGAARPFDPGALMIGLWFGLVGVGAAIAGTDVPAAVVPVSFAITGLGLLLPKRQRSAQ